MSSPFAAPYAQPPVGVLPPPPTAVRTRTLGVMALVVAAVVVPLAAIVGGIASFRIGLGAGKEVASRPFDADFDWSVLTPVRYDVLLGELAFWIGTVLGLWALVQGVVAIVTGRGRAQGIGAVGVAVFGPILFFAVVAIVLGAGLSAGSSIGG